MPPLRIFHSLAGRLSFFLVLALTLIALLVGTAAYELISPWMEEKLYTELETVAAAYREALEAQLKRYLEVAAALARLGLESNTGALLRAEAELERDPHRGLALLWQRELDSHPELGWIELVDRRGVVRWAAPSGRRGLRRRAPEVVPGGRRRPFIAGLCRDANGLYLQVSAPLCDAQGRVCGALVLGFEARPLLDIAADPTGLERSGEILLGAAQGDTLRFLTPLRFAGAQEGEAIAMSGAQAEPMKRAVLGQAGMIHALDYRGVPVIAAYQPILPRGWGLVVKQDEEEAFAPIARLRKLLLAGLGSLLVLSSLIVLLLVGGLTQPLRALEGATRRVMAGDLNTRLNLGAKDEIGRLGLSFNAMVEELAAREAELSRLSSAVEQTADMVMITDRKGIIEYVNPAFERLSGYARAEVLGRTPRLLRSGRHDRGFYRELWQTILSGRTYRAMLINKKKNGALYYVEKVIAPIQDAGGRIAHFVSMDRDITARRQLEEQLRQAQKMDAVGQLTAGIAHNFNNKLMGVMAALEMARLEGAADPALLESAEQSAQEAADIVEQLMHFSRPDAKTFERFVDLRALVGKSVELCRQTFDRKIGFENELSASLPAIAGDALQIEQVLLNLFINARDALAEGRPARPGIEIRGEVVLYEKDAIPHPEARPGQYLRLEIADNGAGMDELTRQRLFDPFFTTKEVGKGTGLGLATAYAVVRDHGGWIECESQPGAGATFGIYFPVAGEGEARDEIPGAGLKSAALEGEAALLRGPPGPGSPDAG